MRLPLSLVAKTRVVLLSLSFWISSKQVRCGAISIEPKGAETWASRPALTAESDAAGPTSRSHDNVDRLFFLSSKGQDKPRYKAIPPRPLRILPLEQVHKMPQPLLKSLHVFSRGPPLRFRGPPPRFPGSRPGYFGGKPPFHGPPRPLHPKMPVPFRGRPPYHAKRPPHPKRPPPLPPSHHHEEPHIHHEEVHIPHEEEVHIPHQEEEVHIHYQEPPHDLHSDYVEEGLVDHSVHNDFPVDEFNFDPPKFFQDSFKEPLPFQEHNPHPSPLDVFGESPPHHLDGHPPHHGHGGPYHGGDEHPHLQGHPPHHGDGDGGPHFEEHPPVHHGGEHHFEEHVPHHDGGNPHHGDSPLHHDEGHPHADGDVHPDDHLNYVSDENIYRDDYPVRNTDNPRDTVNSDLTPGGLKALSPELIAYISNKIKPYT